MAAACSRDVAAQCKRDACMLIKLHFYTLVGANPLVHHGNQLRGSHSHLRRQRERTGKSQPGRCRPALLPGPSRHGWSPPPPCPRPAQPRLTCTDKLTYLPPMRSLASMSASCTSTWHVLAIVLTMSAMNPSLLLPTLPTTCTAHGGRVAWVMRARHQQCPTLKRAHLPVWCRPQRPAATLTWKV